MTEEGNSIREFYGYAYFLLNSDDGNVYVLSQITENNVTRLEFLLKDEEIDPEKTLIGWHEDLLDLAKFVNDTLKYSGVVVPHIFYEKLEEILPIKVKIQKDKETGKRILKFDGDIPE